MNQACAAVGNRDIEKFVPALITAMANPTEVPETVHKLSATTFVQAVEAPALSIMVPLLVRGLRERQTAIKRKSAVIIDNMSKLVDNPADAAVFLPRSTLLPMPHLNGGLSFFDSCSGTPSFCLLADSAFVAQAYGMCG